MHDTALEIGSRFFANYVPLQGARILEIGAMTVNDGLRSVAPVHAEYVGVDLAAGPGVDVVLHDPHVLPFEDGSFSAVASASCFEHDDMFWLTFLETLRVVEDGGYVYISAPSNGWYHRNPRDCWRFYPDCGLSLVDWAHRQGVVVQLVESFTARRRKDVWNDAVMVFCKGEERNPCGRICDGLTDVMNLRRAGSIETVSNPSDHTEDMQIIQRLVDEIVRRDKTIAQLEGMVTQCHDAISNHVAFLNRARAEAA